MARTLTVILGALLGPLFFVAAYRVVAHLAGWPVGPTGDAVSQFGGVAAGVAPILLARGALWARALVAALYAIPCTMAVTFYSLLVSCSLFRQCLS